MKSGIACLVVLLLAVASAELNIAFTANVSGSITANGLNFRETTLSVWNFLGTWSGANYQSAAVSASQGSASLDAVKGAISFNLGSVPYAYVAYFDATVNWDIGGNWAKSNVTASAGFIASAYLALIETDPSGNVVTTQPLTGGVTALGAFGWSAPSSTSTNAQLSWATFTGAPSNNDWSIGLSFVTSDVVGVINQGGATVGPKSLESLVTITNWPYASTKNTLSLTVAVASGDATVSGNSFISGSGDSQVYFGVSSQAVVNGKSEDVQVSGWVDGDYDETIGDANLKDQLTSKYGADLDVKVVTVTFPAGAATILYDPTIGTGQQVPSQASSAFRHAISFAVFVAVAVLTVLF